ncbi:hypothetical protein AGDE_17092 [Angomonas deanei]|uniref:Uncharacterized protein n=1 Tax=Angomonas deanei TaxID=59799 RepID=A0A7G2CAX8_9TRYP|nr:hypothetical protein AGDE_17092 [Angomonas deanei]CAD2216231.1 hypothetical protein, conserved [Angomonas deanei]|eukprot:EPY15505.1 hypothetical protein AGDE_17092 [Angomonas deanei]
MEPRTLSVSGRTVDAGKCSVVRPVVNGKKTQSTIIAADGTTMTGAPVDPMFNPRWTTHDEAAFKEMPLVELKETEQRLRSLLVGAIETLSIRMSLEVSEEDGCPVLGSIADRSMRRIAGEAFEFSSSSDLRAHADLVDTLADADTRREVVDSSIKDLNVLLKDWTLITDHSQFNEFLSNRERLMTDAWSTRLLFAVRRILLSYQIDPAFMLQERREAVLHFVEHEVALVILIRGGQDRTAPFQLEVPPLMELRGVSIPSFRNESTVTPTDAAEHTISKTSQHHSELTVGNHGDETPSMAHTLLASETLKHSTSEAASGLLRWEDLPQEGDEYWQEDTDPATAEHTTPESEPNPVPRIIKTRPKRPPTEALDDEEAKESTNVPRPHPVTASPVKKMVPPAPKETPSGPGNDRRLRRTSSSVFRVDSRNSLNPDPVPEVVDIRSRSPVVELAPADPDPPTVTRRDQRRKSSVVRSISPTSPRAREERKPSVGNRESSRSPRPYHRAISPQRDVQVLVQGQHVVKPYTEPADEEPNPDQPATTVSRVPIISRGRSPSSKRNPCAPQKYTRSRSRHSVADDATLIPDVPKAVVTHRAGSRGRKNTH